MLTRFGKRFITNVLAGNIGITNKELVLGIGTTAATELDTRLEFEFFRIPVSFGSIDIQPKIGGGFNYYAIYKGTIPQDVAGEINEVGLFAGNKTSVNIYDNKFISDFENNLLWTDSSNTNPLFDQTVGAKIGGGMIKVDATTTPKEYSASINTLDVSGYSVNDSLTLAYYKNDNNLSSIKVRLYSSNTNYYEATIVSTPASGTGHRLAKIPFSTVLNGVSGTPDATAIAKVSIITTASSGTTTVYFDGLRVNDEDTFDPTYGIVGRYVLPTPIVKPAGRQVDVEYRLGLFA
jgi:hypothetical protein